MCCWRPFLLKLPLSKGALVLVCPSGGGVTCPPCHIWFGKAPPKVSASPTTPFTEHSLGVSQTTSTCWAWARHLQQLQHPLGGVSTARIQSSGPQVLLATSFKPVDIKHTDEQASVSSFNQLVGMKPACLVYQVRFPTARCLGSVWSRTGMSGLPSLGVGWCPARWAPGWGSIWTQTSPEFSCSWPHPDPPSDSVIF